MIQIFIFLFSNLSQTSATLYFLNVEETDILNRKESKDISKQKKLLQILMKLFWNRKIINRIDKPTKDQHSTRQKKIWEEGVGEVKRVNTVLISIGLEYNYCFTIWDCLQSLAILNWNIKCVCFHKWCQLNMCQCFLQIKFNLSNNFSVDRDSNAF